MEIKDAIKEVADYLLNNQGYFSIWEITVHLSRYYSNLTQDGVPFSSRHKLVKEVFESMDWSNLDFTIENSPHGDVYRKFFVPTPKTQQPVAHQTPIDIKDVEKYVIRNGNAKTLKQIQSRFKLARVTCEELFNMLYHRVSVPNTYISKIIISF